MPKYSIKAGIFLTVILIMIIIVLWYCILLINVISSLFFGMKDQTTFHVRQSMTNKITVDSFPPNKFRYSRIVTLLVDVDLDFVAATQHNLSIKGYIDKLL